MIPMLRKLRIEKRVSMYELSKMTGYGVVEICDVERGKYERTDEFWDAVSKALGIDKNLLMKEDEDEKKCK